MQSRYFGLKLRVDTFKFQQKNIMAYAQPMNAHVNDQSLYESIVLSYYLIPSIKRYQLTDILTGHNYNDRPMGGQIKAKYKQHHSPLEGLECINSKSSRQKCEYLSFHSVYLNLKYGQKFGWKAFKEIMVTGNFY